MARLRSFGWGWAVLLVIAIGSINVLSPRPPARIEPSERVVVAPKMVAPSEPAATTLRASPVVGYVTATNLNVRSSPSASSRVLLSIPQGTKIVATSSSGGWLGLKLNDGSIGWVSADFISSVPPAALVSSPTPDPSPAQQAQPGRPTYDRGAIVQAIIDESIWSTGGSCPCPYNVDRGGRRCGGRSAYSRPGGASPICFAEQVTPGMIERYLARNR